MSDTELLPKSKPEPVRRLEVFTGSGRRRAREIGEWLATRRDVEAFAIVDDLDDAGVEHPRRFVLTTFEHGLTREHAPRLIALLTG